MWKYLCFHKQTNVHIYRVDHPLNDSYAVFLGYRWWCPLDTSRQKSLFRWHWFVAPSSQTTPRNRWSRGRWKQVRVNSPERITFCCGNFASRSPKAHGTLQPNLLWCTWNRIWEAGKNWLMGKYFCFRKQTNVHIYRVGHPLSDSYVVVVVFLGYPPNTSRWKSLLRWHWFVSHSSQTTQRHRRSRQHWTQVHVNSPGPKVRLVSLNSDGRTGSTNRLFGLGHLLLPRKYFLLWILSHLSVWSR